MNQNKATILVCVLLLIVVPRGNAKDALLQFEAYFSIFDSDNSRVEGMQELWTNLVITNVSSQEVTVATKGLNPRVITYPDGRVDVLYMRVTPRLKNGSSVAVSVLEFAPALLRPGESVVLFHRTTVVKHSSPIVFIAYEIDKTLSSRYGMIECHFNGCATRGDPYE